MTLENIVTVLDHITGPVAVIVVAALVTLVLLVKEL